MALIAHWPLNGNTNDISGNNWNGTLKGSPTYVNGKIGQAISLNGSTQYVDIPTIEYLKWRGQEFSVFLWVNLSSDDSDGSIISKPWNGGGQYNYRIYNGTNNIGVYLLGTQGYSLATPSGSIIKDVWNHIGFTVNSTTLKIYINGVKVSEANHGITAWAPSAGDNTESLAIGTLYPYGTFNQPTHAVKGLFNDVRLYDHVLADFEVQELARAKILHYTFDDMQEPTTNKTNDPLFTSAIPANTSGGTFGQWVFGTWSGDTHEKVAGEGQFSTALKITGTATAGANDFWNIGWRDNVPISTVHTVSFYAKGTGQITINSHWAGVMLTINLTNTYQRYEITTTKGTTASHYIYIACANLTDTQTAYFMGFQVELKSYATEFTETSRTGRINDYSGFFNHSDALTEANTPEWTSDAKIGTGAYRFTPSYSYIKPTPSLLPTYKDFTVSAWIYFTSEPTDTNLGYVIVQHYGGGGWILSVRGTDEKLQFRHHRDTANGFTTAYNLLSTFSLQINTWYHVVAKDDGVTAKIYIDGIENNSYTISTIIPGPSSSFPIIGAFSTSGHAHFDGYIDDVRIYATALSDKDILDLYETKVEIEESGVLYAKDFISNAEETINLHGDPVLLNTYTENQAVSKSNWGVDGTLFARKNTAPEAPFGSLMLEMNITSAGSGGLYTDLSRGNGLEYTLIEGKTYTRSWWVKCSDTRSISGHVCSSNRASDNNYIVGGSITVTPEWQKFSHTFTVGVSQGGSYHTRHIIYNEIFSVWVANIQIEEKSYYTPFVTTFRPVVDLPSTIAFAANEVHETGTANFEDFSTVGITDGLVGYWPFNGKAKDYSGNASDGTVYGGVVSKGEYYTFDGEDGSYIDMGNPAVLSALGNQNYITVMALVRYSAYDGGTETYSVITYKGTPWTWLMENPSAKLRFRITAGGVDTNIADPDTHPLNEWLLVVGTYDGATMSIYVNGVLKNSKAQTGALGSTTQPMRIGTYNTNAYMFHGDIAYVKLFNRALTAEEVKLEYNTMLNNEVQIQESGILYAKDLIQY